VALLVRKSSGYELTAAGESATETATKMEQLANELVARVGGVDLTQSGTVRVTVPAFFAQHVLIPELPELRERYAALDVHLVTTDDVLNLASREADIAIRNLRLVCVDSVGGPQPEQIWLVSHPDALKIIRVRIVFDWLKEVFERNAERLAGSA